MPSPWSSSSCHVFSPRLLQFIAPVHGPYCTALPPNDAGHLEIRAIDNMAISTRLEEGWKTQSLSCFRFMFWFNPSSIWVKLIQLGLGPLSFALKATARVTRYGSRPFLEIPILSPLVVFHQSRRLLQRLKDRRVEQVCLKISDPIFVGKITYDNSEYVFYLSNMCLSPSEDCVCRRSETFWIRISMDNVGLQSIDFFDKSSDGNIAPSDNSLWYKVMRPHNRKAICQIQGLSDVCCTIPLSSSIC